MKRILSQLKPLRLFFIVALFATGDLYGQSQPMVVVDLGGPIGNSIPFNSATSNRRAWVYTNAQLTALPPGLITRIYVQATSASTFNFSSIEMNMSLTTLSSFTSGPWPTGTTNVITSGPISLTSFPNTNGSGNWVAFDLQTPFLYDGVSNLIVDVQQTGQSPGFTINQSNVSAASLFGSATAASVNTQDRLAAMGFDWMPAGPCISPPFVGNTMASPSVLCIGNNTNLSVDTLTFGLGQTFQWQSSSDNSTWTNILNDTLMSTSVSVLDTTWYRVGVTCGGVTTFSNPVRVDALGTALPGGTYTINSALPTGGTNFQSFGDFTSAINCGGVSGPVILNVSPNSGPYNEQVLFDNVPSSAVNTITINGNGNRVIFSPSAANRGVFTLAGTSYVTVDNLEVEATGTAAGYGFHLSNGSSNNTISNCNIFVPDNVTSTNFAGIVLGSGTTAIAAAANFPEFNTITNNTIKGGYYAITIIGNNNTSRAMGNSVIGNTAEDFYLYGLYSRAQEDFVYNRNNFSRPSRTQLSTFYGMYFINEHHGGTIANNAIHSSFNANPSSTSVSYLFYPTGASATAAKPVNAYNNIFYNLNGAGSLYGYYNSSSSHWRFYHNSMIVDETNATAGLTYMTYLLGTSDLEVTNNIFSMRRTGTSAKYIHYVTGSGNRTIDYNGYFVDYTQTGNNNFGFIGSGQNNFSDWIANNNNNWDLNSVFDNPDFLSPVTGALIPASGAMNDIGQNLLTIVPTDFLDSARTTTPDPGAFEFDPPPCPRPSANVAGRTDTSALVTWTSGIAGGTYEIEWGPTGFT
ncbi:MAG: right-handed parallel beta-helix repeat-containing protein, partial [Schleiferiaceae bacterium]|nr:right-handed parallel beta-helix repeat-containing protein [Schleiferiaceae bacterium]